MLPKTLFLILVITGICSVLTATPVTIFICGDSTAANKDTSNQKVERGWGQMIQKFFDEAFVKIDNHALNGRSSKSFIDEGHWGEVTKLIKKGDYVIIQFGHNDEKDDETRHTEPGSTFDEYLTKYATETQKLGGIPVLMSPVVRRSWKNGVLVDTHKEYRLVAKKVADALKVHYVDANAITEKLETEMGEEGSKKLHMIFEPGEQPSLPNGSSDNTHYNIYGATTVASLLAEALAKEIPELKDHLKY